MMRRRVGRPGLIGAAARTAVVTGTATAVNR
ncbi:MAG: SHOCT domain-containing protein, partial [Streptomyces sp.]|nr:SHOCT domain-containing protein [Streptomyces sp.]